MRCAVSVGLYCRCTYLIVGARTLLPPWSTYLAVLLKTLSMGTRPLLAPPVPQIQLPLARILCTFTPIPEQSQSNKVYKSHTISHNFTHRQVKQRLKGQKRKSAPGWLKNEKGGGAERRLLSPPADLLIMAHCLRVSQIPSMLSSVIVSRKQLKYMRCELTQYTNFLGSALLGSVLESGWRSYNVWRSPQSVAQIKVILWIG